MIEPDELKPWTSTDEEGISPSPLTAQKSGNSLVLPLIIVGVVTTGILCLVAIIAVSALFIIVATDEDLASLIGTEVVAEESPAGENFPNKNSGDTLFEETFDTDNNGWETGLIENEFGQEEIAIQDGTYTLRVTAEEPFYAERKLPAQIFSDFVLTVEMTPRDSAEHYSYGVTFRQNEDLESYVIELGNDGLYSIFLFTDEWTPLEDWTFSGAINVGQTNELTIRAEGSALTFWVNDEKLTSIEDDTLTEGMVGFVLETFEGGDTTAVDFDNLIIQRP